MNKRSQKIRYIIIRWLCLILVLGILLFGVFIKVKPLVFTYAKSKAETIMLNAANDAILLVLEDENLEYEDIAHITKNENQSITGIEIDAKQVNTLKSLISRRIEDILETQSEYTVSIPAGTLLGSEYTTGIGPKIKFRMQLTETAVVDFKSGFQAAGINNILHQVIVDIDISANILMIGCTKGFNVETSAIAAQTVITGEVPSSFTHVEERPGDDLADEIFNYADSNG